MTQPRKEQILDLKSKFTRIDFADAPNNTLPLGNAGPVQVIQNTGAYPNNFYTQFLGQTVTGIVGGAETSAPAILYGGFGPFALASGQSFTITIPGVNSGNPVNVTFQASDIVTISGLPRITTSRAAARINTALTSAGVYAGSPVAANVNGQLILTSAGPTGYQYGSNIYITVTDVTAGTVSTLGFGTVTSTVNGLTAPQRGIITQSQDGLGGYVQLRSAVQTPAITQSNQFFNLFGVSSYPSIPAGEPLFGRIQAFPGASPPGTDNVTISYFRQGAIPGRVVTSSSNFSTILTSDTFTITIGVFFPNVKAIVVGGPLIVSFAAAPTNPAGVVSAIATTLINASTPGFEVTRGVVVAQNPGTYRFAAGTDQFFIAFNGQTPIQINLTTENTPADVATTITSAIATAGQTAQGQAYVSTTPGIGQGTLVISSKYYLPTDPYHDFTSSVQIFPGSDPLTPTVPGHYYTTLDKLGLVAGITTGFNYAQLYGADEIVFSCLQSNPGTYITIAGSSSVMTKLGLPGTTVTGSSGIGFDPVSAPQVQALIPEMMVFGEVPDNADVITEQFAIIGIPDPVSPSAGLGNLGISPLLSMLDGKVNPDLIRKTFDTLNVGQLTLGATQVGTSVQAAQPRTITPFTTGENWTLLWEADPVPPSASVGRQRLYVDSAGQLWLATNAYATVGGSNWNREVSGSAASVIVLAQATGVPKIMSLYSPPSAGSPFNWVFSPALALDPGGANNSSSGFLQVGTQTAADDNVPRILAYADQTLGNYTLLYSVPANPSSSSPGARLYTLPSGSGTAALIWTINAAWGGASWVKDILGAYAIQMIIEPTGLFVNVQQQADNLAWTSWDQTTFQVLNSNNTVSVGELLPGFNQPSTATGRGTPRISTTHNSTTAGQRTLIETWQGGDGLNFYRYRCCEPSGTFAFNDCIMESVNAYWDETTQQWNKEQAYNNSQLTIISGSQTNVYFKGGNNPFQWPDTTWNLAFEWGIGSALINVGTTIAGANEGLIINSTNNVNNQGGISNVLKSKNIPVAWAIVVVDSGSIGLIDSYNVSSVSFDSSTIIYVNLYAGIPIGSASQSPMCIIGNGGLFLVTALEPSNVIVSGVGNNSSNQLFFEAWTATSGTAINVETSTAWFSIVVYGTM